jgi:hypothetical protein
MQARVFGYRFQPAVSQFGRFQRRIPALFLFIQATQEQIHLMMHDHDSRRLARLANFTFALMDCACWHLFTSLEALVYHTNLQLIS